jgi:hypothetical protein
MRRPDYKDGKKYRVIFQGLAFSCQALCSGESALIILVGKEEDFCF